MKKITCILTALLLIAALMLTASAESLPGLNPAPGVVSANTDTGIDIVVVIDRSGSMGGSNGNDPKNIALAATKALASVSAVDDIGLSGGVNMAVIAYGYDVLSTTRELPGLPDGFVDVSDSDQLRRLEELIDTNEKVDTLEDTNTGLALETAYAMIEARRANHPSHTFAVVLLSDGKVDVGDSKGFLSANGLSDADRKNKTAQWQQLREQETAASVSRGSAAAQSLAGDAIPLYCIGIYSDSKDSLGKDMENWALSTPGGDYKITNDINEVYDLMNDIYTRINAHAERQQLVINSGEKGRFRVEVGIVQVNIQVRPSFSGAESCEINYVDLNGAAKSYPLSSSNIEQSTGTGDSYTIISMPSPEAGDYTIAINDGNDHQFNLDIFSIRDLKMVIDKINDSANGDPVEICLEVTKDGNLYYDENGNLPVVTISNSEGAVLVTDDRMSWNPDAARYTYVFTPSRVGSYSVTAKLVKDGLTNVANVEGFSVTPAPVRPRANLDPVSFTGHAVTRYDSAGAPSAGYAPVVISYDDLLARNFENVDNRVIDRFSCSVDDPANAVQVTNDPGARTITIAPRDGGNATATLTVWAEFEGATSGAVTGEITVQDAQAPVALSAAGAALPTQLEEVKGLLPTDAKTACTVSTNGQPATALTNVNSLFTEPNAADGEGFTVSVSVLDAGMNAASGAEAALDANGQLTLKGVQEGDYVVRLTATGYDGSTASLNLTLTVTNMLSFYLMIAGGALIALILIILIIKVVHEKSKPQFSREGMLVVELYCDDDHSDGVAKLARYGRKPVKLSAVCASNHIDMFAMRGMLDKIIITPRKRGGVTVSYNIKGVGKREMSLRSMESQTIELSDDRRIDLSFNDGDDNF